MSGSGETLRLITEAALYITSFALLTAIAIATLNSPLNAKTTGSALFSLGVWIGFICFIGVGIASMTAEPQRFLDSSQLLDKDVRSAVKQVIAALLLLIGFVCCRRTLVALEELWHVDRRWYRLRDNARLSGAVVIVAFSALLADLTFSEFLLGDMGSMDETMNRLGLLVLAIVLINSMISSVGSWALVNVLSTNDVASADMSSSQLRGGEWMQLTLSADGCADSLQIWAYRKQKKKKKKKKKKQKKNAREVRWLIGRRDARAIAQFQRFAAAASDAPFATVHRVRLQLELSVPDGSMRLRIVQAHKIQAKFSVFPRLSDRPTSMRMNPNANLVTVNQSLLIACGLRIIQRPLLP